MHFTVTPSILCGLAAWTRTSGSATLRAYQRSRIIGTSSVPALVDHSTSQSCTNSGTRHLSSVCLKRFTALLVVFALYLPAFAQTGSTYNQVDPFIGTAGGGFTSPAASLPFGMIQWGPSTSARGYYNIEEGTIH